MNAMRTNVSKLALLGLHASVGLVVFVQAALLAFAPAQIAAFHKTGLHDAIRILLAWGEALFACLFLLPRTMKLGGYGLLIIFFAAMGLHFLHGGGGIEVLLIYAAAVAVVVSGKPDHPDTTRSFTK
jgi:hypothetical protein